MEACQVMTSPTITISPGASVRQAITTMLDHRVSGLPVVDETGRLAGIVSEGDLLRRAEIGTEKHRPKWLECLLGPGRSATDYVHSHSRRVADVMTNNPVFVDERASLAAIVALMEKHRVKRVPVLRDSVVVGIVTRADLLRAFVRHRAMENVQTFRARFAQAALTDDVQTAAFVARVRAVPPTER